MLYPDLLSKFKDGFWVGLFAPTEGQAWADARQAAVQVMGRLEAPGGGQELREALSGAPVAPRVVP